MIPSFFPDYSNLTISYSKVDTTQSPLHVFKDISNALSIPGCHSEEGDVLPSSSSSPPFLSNHPPRHAATVVITDLTSIAFQYIALECQLREFVLLSTAEKLRHEVSHLFAYSYVGMALSGNT